MAANAFELLKSELGDVVLGSIDDDDAPFVVECDTFDVAVLATLNRRSRRVAFMSCTLNYPLL